MSQILTTESSTFNPYVDNPLLTVDEAAAYCRVSKSTIQKWRRDGLIPCVRMFSDIRFRRSDLNKFIESRISFRWMKGV